MLVNVTTTTIRALETNPNLVNITVANVRALVSGILVQRLLNAGILKPATYYGPMVVAHREDMKAFCKMLTLRSDADFEKSWPSFWQNIVDVTWAEVQNQRARFENEVKFKRCA